MEAGRADGIVAFGLEAQRILRLEKQHILVGQDTDAESDPYEVGLGWMVKDDKEDFLGLRSLRDLKERGPRERLVGFTAPRALAAARGRVRGPRGSVGRPGHVGAAERGRRLGGRAGVGARGVGRRTEARSRSSSAGATRSARSGPTVLRPARREAPVVSTAIRRSPAARLSSRRGAIFVEEAGWEIPASYGDDAEERAAIRDRVAIADITARAKVDVRGRIPETLAIPGRHRRSRGSRAEWVVVLGAPDAEGRLAPGRCEAGRRGRARW